MEAYLLLTLIAIVILTLVICFVIYILHSISHYKMFKIVGYKDPWLAWIPYIKYYALVDCMNIVDEKVELLPRIMVPLSVLKFWWVSYFFVSWIPHIGIYILWILNWICLGYCYKILYSRLYNKPVSEVKWLAYFSGLISLIPIVKFLCLKQSQVL